MYTHVRYMAMPPGVDKVMSGEVCIIFGAPLVCGVLFRYQGLNQIPGERKHIEF